MSERDDFLATFIPRQVEVEKAIQRGDAEPRLALWARADPVTLFGAWGPCKRGWEDVERTFRWVASRFSDGADYELELVAADVSGDMAYTVGYERTSSSVDGGPVTPNVLRVTHIYRREGGEWRIVHRHGDHLPEDQSPH
jgi:ketosteroid isomerase-like protein